MDVFSTYIDNVSNHVALWGGKKAGGSAAALAAAQAYDAEVRRRSQTTLLATPSLWAGIEGSYGRLGHVRSLRATGTRWVRRRCCWRCWRSSTGRRRCSTGTISVAGREL